ncbi:hypothetical protein TFLX_02688 [Thermoflexales bacterium]|nr:hypothetical protein TFLX_02688 [Thermoflexales bacterium]
MSAPKTSQLRLCASLLALTIGLVALFAPQTAGAQCEDSSPSCCTCHATAHPVFEQGEWHTIHARQECCRACHGGNDRTDDQDAAHVGMMLHPLEDTYLACHACHPEDYRQRAEVFAVVLHVTPQSSEPKTPSPVPTITPSSILLTPLAQTTTAITPAWDWPVVLIIAIPVIALALLWRRSHSS